MNLEMIVQITKKLHKRSQLVELDSTEYMLLTPNYSAEKSAQGASVPQGPRRQTFSNSIIENLSLKAQPKKGKSYS